MIVGDTTIHISLKKLGENLDALRRLVGPEVAVMAVIKANGYGHGAEKIAPTLLEHGARYLAVARLEEALPLRQAMPDAPLFVLGYTPDRLLKTAVENDITLTIFSVHQARILGEAAASLNKTATVHLKVETGFHRLGTDDPQELLSILNVPNVYAEGIYSHLALLDRPSDEIQRDKFLSIVRTLEQAGHTFRYRMKGFESDALTLQPVMTMRTRIARLMRIRAGEGVGYDLSWRAPRDSLIATLPFGYADGYPRALGGKGYVTIRGKKCPLVGILCMDQCVADVTDLEVVEEGDPVIIYGDGTGNTLSVAEAATLAGCNKNEILCRLTERPARIYEA